MKSSIVAFGPTPINNIDTRLEVEYTATIFAVSSLCSAFAMTFIFTLILLFVPKSIATQEKITGLAISINFCTGASIFFAIIAKISKCENNFGAMTILINIKLITIASIFLIHACVVYLACTLILYLTYNSIIMEHITLGLTLCGTLELGISVIFTTVSFRHQQRGKEIIEIIEINEIV